MPDEGYPDNRKKWPRVVAFDTSGPFLSLGWSWQSYSGGTVIDMARGQAEALMPALEDMLAECGWVWTDVDAIGVGVGPGNFTGIRIAVSAARGLGLGLGVPVFGISSFALGYGWHEPPSGTLISLPAPQDMAYVQGFRVGDPAVLAGVLIDPAAPPPELQLSFGMSVYGHRADEIASALEAQSYPLPSRPEPGKMAEIAEDMYLTSPDFPPRPAPFYIKPADASPGRDAPPRILA